MGIAFTGQVLRFDQDSYWGLGIGASITGRAPFLGAQLVNFLLAGPIIGGEILSRFFTFHVFMIPWLILAFVALPLRLVLTKGINAFPAAGKPVIKAAYDRQYEELLDKEGLPFVPHVIGKDLMFAGIVMVGILVCSVVFGPKGPSGHPIRPLSRRCLSRIIISCRSLPAWLCCPPTATAPNTVERNTPTY